MSGWCRASFKRLGHTLWETTRFGVKDRVMVDIRQGTEQSKDNAAKKRKQALEIIREKRSKKRNDGGQSKNIAPDQFDSPQAQNEFSQAINTSESLVKYFRKKKIFLRKTLKTPRVATPDSELQIVEFQQQTRSQPLEVPPLALSLPSSVQEELIKDDFIYVPPQEETQQTSNNDCPQEAEKQGVTVSLTSSVIEDLFKDDYVYEVSNEDPAKEQQQQAQEPPVQQQSEQEVPVNPCEEATAQQSKQEAPIDNPKTRVLCGLLQALFIKEFFKDADVYQVSDEEQLQEPPVAQQSEKETLILSSFDSAAQPRKREDERPSFSLGISPPASQPTQPSQESDSQLEILAEAVVDAGVINHYFMVYILKGVEIGGNELICRFRPAPDAIRLASQIRHSSGITSASFHFLQALILQLKYAEHDLCKYLQALILQLKHVPLSPGSRSIHTGIPTQSFKNKAYGLTLSHRHHNYLLSVTLS
ncbi:hypothetical protein AHAS_Ahas13G0253300 [Arachis hypogaea]